MARSTKAQAAQTRDQLLDAAEQVFHQRGVARTSLADVAAAAGLTRGAIYWHFADKPALVMAMARRVTLPWDAADEAVARLPAAQALEALEALALAPLGRLAASEQSQRVVRILTQYTEYTDELAPLRHYVEQRVQRHLERMAQLLEQAARARLLVPRLPRAAAAQGLQVLACGLMREWLFAPARFDLVATARVAVRVYIAGLRAPQGPPRSSPAPRGRRPAPRSAPPR